MHLTRKADYSILIILEIASQEGWVSLREISQKTKIPLSFTRNILYSLSKGGLILSKEGIRGGYKIARPVNDISVKNVIEASGFNLAMTLCMHSTCDKSSFCRSRKILEKVNNEIIDKLDQIKVKDLIYAENT
jgi:Rrf2 family protein